MTLECLIRPVSLIFYISVVQFSLPLHSSDTVGVATGRASNV